MPVSAPVAIMEVEPISAVAGAPISAVERVPIEEPEPIGPIVDGDPATDTLEWADLYAQSVARHRDERDRIDLDHEEPQRLCEEFLAVQGSKVPEGDRWRLLTMTSTSNCSSSPVRLAGNTSGRT